MILNKKDQKLSQFSSTGEIKKEALKFKKIEADLIYKYTNKKTPTEYEGGFF